MLPCNGLMSLNRLSVSSEASESQVVGRCIILKSCKCQVICVDAGKNGSLVQSLRDAVLQAPYFAKFSATGNQPRLKFL